METEGNEKKEKKKEEDKEEERRGGAWMRIIINTRFVIMMLSSCIGIFRQPTVMLATNVFLIQSVEVPTV